MMPAFPAGLVRKHSPPPNTYSLGYSCFGGAVFTLLPSQTVDGRGLIIQVVLTDAGGDGAPTAPEAAECTQYALNIVGDARRRAMIMPCKPPVRNMLPLPRDASLGSTLCLILDCV